ncbi:DUF6011 domain-containing protein [Rhodococcus sp. BP-241]|uniref:DUF6011 domain-containing protein n=1 Tax=Rhodococcus sp. BP-241 TaxID=2739441 RepID=UPI001C9B0B06
MIPPIDPDEQFEKVVDPADRLLNAALRSGTFRLASQCTACGAWLVNPVSIRRHLGPRCAKRAQDGSAA